MFVWKGYLEKIDDRYRKKSGNGNENTSGKTVKLNREDFLVKEKFIVRWGVDF